MNMAKRMRTALSLIELKGTEEDEERERERDKERSIYNKRKKDKQ